MIQNGPALSSELTPTATTRVAPRCLALLVLQAEKPPLTKEKSSRFANFFQSGTSAPGAAPVAPAPGTASTASGPTTPQAPFSTQLGGQALLQQLQAAQQEQQQVCDCSLPERAPVPQISLA